MAVSFDFTEETERFAALPQSLRRVSRLARLGSVGPASGRSAVPALLCHPDWATPAPTVIWIHGRTAFKELDPGRYSRWIKAGLAVCALDAPAHGERADGRADDPANSLDLIAEGVAEMDGVVAALAAQGEGIFDTTRLAVGGLSLGGMITLRRLCDEHQFRAALVEATTGDLACLYSGRHGRGWPVAHDPSKIAAVDPSAHLASFRPIPLMALHSEADRVVPWACQKGFLERLARHYDAGGVEVTGGANLIQIRTWPQTGAPDEHIGFGTVANEAKNAGTAFLAASLGTAPG